MASAKPSSDERVVVLVLGAAMAVAAGVILWEGAGTTLFNDEVALFQSLGAGFDAETVLRPRNGHLLAISTLLYEAVFATVGPDYLILRILGVIGLLALAAVLFIYVRRRAGSLLALAPAVVVLFLGASWETLLWPISIATFVLALTAGIGALLMLERRDLAGDVAAMALLALAVASHSIGLPFLLGAAVAVLGQGSRQPARRYGGLLSGAGRAWVFLLPLALYATWWIWAQAEFDEPSALRAVNVWLIPSYVAESLAIVLAAVTGLSATLTGEGINPTIEIEAGWGRPLALLALAALAFRAMRQHLPAAFWATLVILLTYWSLAALSLGPDRIPEESRYILPGAVLVFLVAANALSGLRVPRPATIVVLAVAAVSVTTGIRQLHDGSLFLEDYSQRARATFTGIEQAGSATDPAFDPRADPELSERVPSQLPLQAGAYLEAVERFGSPAFTEQELIDHGPEATELAESVAARARAGLAEPSP